MNRVHEPRGKGPRQYLFTGACCAGLAASSLLYARSMRHRLRPTPPAQFFPELEALAAFTLATAITASTAGVVAGAFSILTGVTSGPELHAYLRGKFGSS